MNAPVRTSSATLRVARDIAVQALAHNAGPEDADEVVNYALGDLGYRLRLLQRAYNDGLEPDRVEAELIILQEHVEALQKFAEAFLDVHFQPLAGNGGE